MKDPKPETPPLTRAGRKIADATLAAAKFTPTSDGNSAIRSFDVHGMAVTECVNVTSAIPAGKPPEKPAVPISIPPKTHAKTAGPETPPLTRSGRRLADAELSPAQFKPTVEGKRMVRQFEVHGMAVTEFISADNAADTLKERK